MSRTMTQAATAPADGAPAIVRAARSGTSADAGADAVAVLARHGRSFRLAGRLLPRAVLHEAAELYAFCRAVDDLADEAADPHAAREALFALRRALLEGDTRHPLAGGFLASRAGTEDGVFAALALIDTVLLDLGPVRVTDEAGLLRYAYGVAGTVGLMMCTVLGARTPAAEPHAIDLGIAMQLTNIARDVAEDAARDRLYLPAAWLPPGFGPGDLARAPDAAFAAVERVLARADRHYRSAELGLCHLPPRVRPAIRAAGRLYEAIGPRVLRRGPAGLLTGRSTVPTPRKLLLAAGCLFGRAQAGPHDPALHATLGGLPGARTSAHTSAHASVHPPAHTGARAGADA